MQIAVNGIEGVVGNSGRFYPIPMGGSNTETSTEAQGQGSLLDNQGTGEPESQSYGDGFLSRVPEEHRPILEPYIKQWDAGVTRKFQELHSQYAPYSELGDLEELQSAYELWQYIQESPEEVYRALHQEYGQQAVEQGPQEQIQQQSELQGLPPEVAEELTQLRSIVEFLAENHLESRNAQQAQQEDAELDEYFDLLHQEFGDFDDDFVLAKMEAGMDGEAAVNEYLGLIQSIINQQAETSSSLPRILSGGGASPKDTPQSLGSASSDDIKKLVAGLVSNTQQQAS